MSSVMYPEGGGRAHHMKCTDWWRLVGKSWEQVEKNPYKSHNEEAVIIAKGNRFEGEEAE